jgi:hypothetical protein
MSERAKTPETDRVWADCGNTDPLTAAQRMRDHAWRLESERDEYADRLAQACAALDKIAHYTIHDEAYYGGARYFAKIAYDKARMPFLNASCKDGLALVLAEAVAEAVRVKDKLDAAINAAKIAGQKEPHA